MGAIPKRPSLIGQFPSLIGQLRRVAKVPEGGRNDRIEGVAAIAFILASRCLYSAFHRRCRFLRSRYAGRCFVKAGLAVEWIDIGMPGQGQLVIGRCFGVIAHSLGQPLSGNVAPGNHSIEFGFLGSKQVLIDMLLIIVVRHCVVSLYAAV